MKTDNTVSVIIPAYNAATTIACAIESALQQTYPPLEILVVDDGSTDGTAAVVEQYSEPVRLLRKANGGPGSARNLGAREATGNWIALLDADDSWLPNKLETQLPYAHSPATGVIFYPISTPAANYLPGELAFTCLWENNFVLASSVLMRREAFEAVGGFNEARELIGVEDYNLWLRLAAANWAFALCPVLATYYTPVPGHLSGQSMRMLDAGLYNVMCIGEMLPLDESMRRQKRLALLEAFSRSLFYKRDMLVARQALARLYQAQPSFFALTRWLATFLPPLCWGWRRSRTRRAADTWRIEHADTQEIDSPLVNELESVIRSPK